MEDKILIAEPDRHHAEKLVNVFRKKNLWAVATHKAAEAIRTIQQEHFSVLIMDVGLQDMSWDEVFPIVKNLSPRLPIIMTSSINTPQLEASILHHKAFYYHVKTFGTDELVLAVQNAVGKSKTGK